MGTELLEEPEYLEVGCTPCLAEVDRLGWAATVPLRAGGRCLGVRVSSTGLDALVRRLFSDRVVAGASPPPNLSLRLAPAGGARRELHRLYWVFKRSVRTRSATRALDALWHELDAHDARARTDRILLDATVLVRADGAHVLPAWARPTVVDHERRWARDGFQLVDRRWVELDLEGGGLVLPPSGLAWDDEAAAALDALDVEDRAEPPQPSGSVPIASWTPFAGEASPAARVMEAAGQVLDRQALGGAGWVAALADLLGEVPQAVAHWERIDEVRAGLAED